MASGVYSIVMFVLHVNLTMIARAVNRRQSVRCLPTHRHRHRQPRAHRMRRPAARAIMARLPPSMLLLLLLFMFFYVYVCSARFRTSLIVLCFMSSLRSFCRTGTWKHAVVMAVWLVAQWRRSCLQCCFVWLALALYTTQRAEKDQCWRFKKFIFFSTNFFLQNFFFSQKKKKKSFNLLLFFKINQQNIYIYIFANIK